MRPADRALLRFAVFAAGALLMSLEVAAFRIIGKTFGAALRETTTVIAVFLTAMSLGYWVGGRAGDRRPHATTLAASLFAAAASLLAVPWIDAALSPRIAASSLPLFAHAFLATAILFALPTILLAATSPIAIRLFATTTGASGSTAGSISAISTIGSIAGSVVTAFVLLDWLAGIARTVLFVAAATCVTALLVTLTTVRARRALVAIASAIVLVLMSTAFLRSSPLEQTLLTPLPGAKVLFVGDSPYHRIVVRERPPVRELVFNVAIQTRMRVSNPNGPGLPYIAAMHIAPLVRPGTRRVLLIGLGGGTFPKQLLRFHPGATIDVVEVDPLVVTVARRWFALPDDPRLRVFVADGRTFLKRSREQWDLIIVDAYTTNRYGDTIPAHLTTREFFEEAASHLSERGVLHFHCTFTASRLLPALERTLGAVYPFVARTQGELLASRAPIELRPEELFAGAKLYGPATLPHFSDALRDLRASKAPQDAVLLTDDYAPVDTLLR